MNNRRTAATDNTLAFSRTTGDVLAGHKKSILLNQRNAHSCSLPPLCVPLRSHACIKKGIIPPAMLAAGMSDPLYAARSARSGHTVSCLSNGKYAFLATMYKVYACRKGGLVVLTFGDAVPFYLPSSIATGIAASYPRKTAYWILRNYC